MSHAHDWGRTAFAAQMIWSLSVDRTLDPRLGMGHCFAVMVLRTPVRS